MEFTAPSFTSSLSACGVLRLCYREYGRKTIGRGPSLTVTDQAQNTFEVWMYLIKGLVRKAALTISRQSIES